MVLFRVLPIKIVDIFYSVEIVGYMVACVMQTHLEKVVNTTFRKGCEYNFIHIAVLFFKRHQNLLLYSLNMSLAPNIGW